MLRVHHVDGVAQHDDKAGLRENPESTRCRIRAVQIRDAPIQQDGVLGPQVGEMVPSITLPRQRRVVGGCWIEEEMRFLGLRETDRRMLAEITAHRRGPATRRACDQQQSRCICQFGPGRRLHAGLQCARVQVFAYDCGQTSRDNSRSRKYYSIHWSAASQPGHSRSRTAMSLRAAARRRSRKSNLCRPRGPQLTGTILRRRDSR